MECCGKFCYPTRPEANRARRFMRNEIIGSGRLRVYRCTEGNGFHLSSHFPVRTVMVPKFARVLEQQDRAMVEEA